MKKFLSVLLLLTLLLSLSVSVFARYEICPDCDARLERDTDERVIDEVPCPVMEEEDGVVHDKIGMFERLTCTNCDYDSDWVMYDWYIDCPH